MQHFIVMHDEPLFFILEFPLMLKMRQRYVQMRWVNYINDGCSQKKALTIISRVGNLLYNDGLSSFGYGGHESGDEIIFSKYNVLIIFSKNIEKYNKLFDIHDIKRKNNIITAWDTFSREHPGASEKITIDNLDVYTIPKQFEDWGMYFAERREED